MSTVPPELPDFETRASQLRGPLLAELERTPPRRRGRAALVALVIGLVAIAVALMLASRDPSEALAVEREDGWIVLRIADPSADAAAFTRSLRTAGIRGEVRLMAVRPDEIGTWAIFGEWPDPRPSCLPPRRPIPRCGSDGRRNVVRLNRVRNDAPTTLRIPVAAVRQSTGYFIFYIGRAAAEGEDLYRDGQMRFKKGPPFKRGVRGCPASPVFLRRVVRAGAFKGTISRRYDILEGAFRLHVGRYRDAARGRAQAIPWSVHRRIRTAARLRITGRRIGARGRTFVQTFRRTQAIGDAKRWVFPSILEPPAEGCWRLRFRSGAARGAVTVLVTDGVFGSRPRN